MGSPYEHGEKEIGLGETMTPIMKQKIDAVLDRVKEPETGLSVAQLGLVERLRYKASEQTLSVMVSDVNRGQHTCCIIIQGLILSSVLNALTAELKKEFPNLTIDIG